MKRIVKYAADTAPPQDVAGDYLQQQDGSWLLDTDVPFEDVTGLKAALAAERKSRRDAEESARTIQERYQGMTPERYRELEQQVANLKDKQILDSDGMDALRTTIVQEHERNAQRILAAKDRELDTVKTERDRFQRQWQTDRLTSRILEASARANTQKNAQDDIVRAALTVFSRLDEQGNPLAVDGVGEVIYGKDGTSPKTPDEWLADMKPHKQTVWWPPSQGSGRGAGHGTGQYSGPDLSGLPPEERITRYRQQQREAARK